MEVFTVQAIGGQIITATIENETLPAWLVPTVLEMFKERGYAIFKSPEFECYIYPTIDAARAAVDWSLN